MSELEAGTHECPGPDCKKRVTYDQLACSQHWYQIPRALRSAVWRAWDRGNGAGTPAHDAAIAAAIRSLQGPGER